MSDELAGALRELAAQHETPPRVDAAEIRGRAQRRSRRRKVTAVLGTAATAACALAAVAFTLHPEDPAENRQVPATASDTPPPTSTTATPSPAPAGLLDLGRHTLTVGDRVMRVDSHSFGRFPSGSRMTVVAKADLELLPLEGNPEVGKEVKVPYLVELRTPDRQAVYTGALAFDTRALGALSAETGWVGMSITDAEWFYHRIRVGDRIEITSTVLPSPGETAAARGYTAAPPGYAGTAGGSTAVPTDAETADSVATRAPTSPTARP
ncbi:hypothetical protein GCM10010294_21270 [Streptomyces griseoloalbus]|uniref:hypothetical protein n=1 Tax=Streptomyces griseoloalbus TaxID=67303 RepID=UPI0018766AF4|nr:hypothetical protein GCM10010294_21270 [Streptomyces griseoloalbus]